MDHFAKLGFDVWTLDHEGYGRSSKTDSNSDIASGVEDLRAGIIRTIGNADERYEEDPVRMMRALEYSVRLGFDLEEETRAAIDRCRSSIENASPARLSYELYESLRSGSASGICGAWYRAGIFERAFPGLGCGREETAEVLRTIDKGMSAGAKYADASLVGAFFLPRFYGILDSMAGDGQRIDNVRLLEELRTLLDPTAAAMHLTNHTVHLLHQGLFTHTKLRRSPDRGRLVLKLARQDYFQVAWDLFDFAAAAGLADREAHQAWQKALGRVRSDKAAEEIVVDPAPTQRRRRRRRRPRSRRQR